jgi:hypothetical protein
MTEVGDADTARAADGILTEQLKALLEKALECFPC